MSTSKGVALRKLNLPDTMVYTNNIHDQTSTFDPLVCTRAF